MSTNIFCLRPCDQFKAVTEANFKAGMAMGALKVALERAVEGWIEERATVHALSDQGPIRCARREMPEMFSPPTCDRACGTCDTLGKCNYCAHKDTDTTCDAPARIRCVAEGLFRQAMEPPKIEVAH